jgi:hypothetical protein
MKQHREKGMKGERRINKQTRKTNLRVILKKSLCHEYWYNDASDLFSAYFPYFEKIKVS